MDNSEIASEAPQTATSDTSRTFTHAHSFALRQAVLNQLNSSQKAEHESINTMRGISTSNTEQVLEILTHWLCFDCFQASHDEIEAVKQISDQRHDDWQKLVERKNELEVSMHVTSEDLVKAEKKYNEIGGFGGAKELWAKEDEKKRIQEAKATVKALKTRKDELDKGIKETGAELDTYVDKFLQNCCNNLERMPGSSPLGKKLHDVIAETKKKVSDELQRHSQDQQKQLELIESSIACLKGMYSLGEQL